MFEDKKTLIVVYKDEMVLNLLKKKIESNKDPVQVVSWDEKMWRSQKKAGNIDDKVLFIGHVKDVDALLPHLDMKFNRWGIKYGWSGNQAVIAIDASLILAEFKEKQGSGSFYEAFRSYPELAQTESKNVEAVKAFAKEWEKMIARIAIPRTLKTNPDEVGMFARDRYQYGVLHFYENYFKEFMEIKETEEDV